MKAILSKGNLARVLGTVCTLMLVFFVTDVLAQGGGGGGGGGQTLGSIAENVTQSFTSFGKLILGVSFVAGLGFTMAAIFKFKQHKDNPTQIPLGTPLAMLAIGIVLMFLPGVIQPAGTTIFGSESTSAAGGFTGGAATKLPGNQSQ